MLGTAQLHACEHSLPAHQQLYWPAVCARSMCVCMPAVWGTAWQNASDSRARCSHACTQHSRQHVAQQHPPPSASRRWPRALLSAGTLASSAWQALLEASGGGVQQAGVPSHSRCRCLERRATPGLNAQAHAARLIPAPACHAIATSACRTTVSRASTRSLAHARSSTSMHVSVGAPCLYQWAHPAGCSACCCPNASC